MPQIDWQKFRRLRLMTHAFFDDAGTTHVGSSLLVMAGLVASDNQFQDLSARWMKRVRRAGLPHLHAADFLSGQGEYRALGWGWTERLDLARDLLGVVADTTSFALVVAVEQKALKAVMSRAAPKGRGTVYSFLMNRLFRRCLDEMKEQGALGPLYPTFDDSEREAQGILGGYHQALRDNPGLREEVASICFADDRHVVPIQAADLMACAALRLWRAGGEESPDGLFHHLAANCRVLTELWDADEIARQEERLMAAFSA